MTSNFKVNGIDTDDLWVRKEFFTEGGLWSWGNNTYGQVGDNTIVEKQSPVQIVGRGINWKLVSAGTYHAAGIKSDGTLWLWGRGSEGQLGNNALTHRSSPVQTVAGGTNWKLISAGSYYNLGLKTDGTLWAWGNNDSGQLGNGDVFVSRSSPVQVLGFGNWRQASAGQGISAGIKLDGTLWTWGDGGNGQIGNNSTTTQSSPVQTIAGGNQWKQVSCGGGHVAAIKNDGTLWLWGYNGRGQLGDGTTTNRSSPVQTIAGGTDWKYVDAGRDYTAAIKTDGSLWLWGHNQYGRLGNGTTTHRSSPVQTIAGGFNWKHVALGPSTAYAIKTDGSLWVWGSGANGAAADGTNINTYSSPVQTIMGGSNWKTVDGGDGTGIAVIEDYY